MNKCKRCGKSHEHYHTRYGDGSKNYDKCYECCEMCERHAKKLKITKAELKDILKW